MLCDSSISALILEKNKYRNVEPDLKPEISSLRPETMGS